MEIVKIHMGKMPPTYNICMCVFAVLLNIIENKQLRNYWLLNARVPWLSLYFKTNGMEEKQPIIKWWCQFCEMVECEQQKTANSIITSVFFSHKFQV